MTCDLLIIKHVSKTICEDHAKWIFPLLTLDQAFNPRKTSFYTFGVFGIYCTFGRLALILK